MKGEYQCNYQESSNVELLSGEGERVDACGRLSVLLSSGVWPTSLPCQSPDSHITLGRWPDARKDLGYV